jgi:hypothetical protein
MSRPYFNTDSRYRRTKATDWKTKTFVKPITSAWDLPLPSDQVSILLRGFQPRRQQDKWFVYADDKLEANGIIKVHIFRSWCSSKMAEITIRIPTSTTSTKPPRITQIIWESDENIISGNSEDRAKRSVQELYSWVLAKQTSIDEPILVEKPTITKTKSWRSDLEDRLTEITLAIQAPPKRALPRSGATNPYSSTCQVVDVPKLDIATRPAVFHCPPSP